MKVLMTADGVGGVWTYAVELARGLAPHGVEVLLATAGGPLTEAQRKAASSLGDVQLIETSYRLEWMDDPWEDVAAFGRLLLKLAADFQPDLVHLNEYSHAALRFHAPVLVVGHSCVCSWYESVRGRAPGREWKRYRQAVARGLRAADLVLAPTGVMLDALERHYGPLRASGVVANGYTPLEALDADGEKEPFVFAAGRWWDEAKNLAALGAVAPRLRWPVRVAGLPAPDGSATSVPVNVESLGRLTSEEMSAQYARAGIYCLPARYEPFGLTPLEAACHGCALVLGDIPSLREIWEDAAAFVPPEDVGRLAGVLERLIEDEAARRALADAGRERARGFSRARMARETMTAYESLVYGAALVTSLSVGGAA
jgi:glycosyltransferase involved in cell wall biosynthesis